MLYIALDGCANFRVDDTDYYLEGKEKVREIIDSFIKNKRSYSTLANWIETDRCQQIADFGYIDGRIRLTTFIYWLSTLSSRIAAE